MDVSQKQRYELKNFIEELEQYKGSSTEFVSVYIPQDYDINKIIQHLREEKSTADNIKSKSTRKNVQNALDKMIRQLRVYEETPPNGLAAFSGNIASQEGKQDVRVWTIEPPVPIDMRIYECGKEFVLEHLKKIAENKNIYGLVVIDRRDAHIALLKGKQIIPLTNTHSHVPGKHKAGGQCLTKDTFVQASDGNIIELEDTHNPVEVKSVNTNDLVQKSSQITDKWNSTKKDIYTITTKHPRLEIKSSSDHVFFTMSKDGIKEKPAEELSKDDTLIMPEEIEVNGTDHSIDSIQYYNSFIINEKGQDLIRERREEKDFLQKELAEDIGVHQRTISRYEKGQANPESDILNRLCEKLGIDHLRFLKEYTKPYLHQESEIQLPKKLDVHLAQFLGYITGDGYVSEDRITCFEQDEDVAMEYKKDYNDYFNLNCSYKFREDKNYYQLRFTSRPLTKLIDNEFPEIKDSYNSRIPEKVLKSNDEVLAKYLRGLFDAEGYISRGRIGLGMNNKKIVQQVQLSLLRFGIISSLYEYDNKENDYSDKNRYSIDISEKKSLSLFEENIGFTLEEKHKKLKRSVEENASKNKIRQVLIPGSKIREIIESYDMQVNDFPKVSDFFRNEKMMSKEVFEKSVIEEVDSEELKKELNEIKNKSFLPLKIKDIKKESEEENLVDISVEEGNFIANGVLVHNSAQRFDRLIENAAKDHYKKVAEYMEDQFLNEENLKGILIGGPGQTKKEFLDKGGLNQELKDKVITVKDLSYTGEFGLQELVNNSKDVLRKEKISDEKEIVGEFLKLLKTNPDKVAYGEEKVSKAAKIGATETIMISEELSDEKVEDFIEKAENVSSEVELISTETSEGQQLKDMGGVAAILRYEVNV